MLMVTTRNEIDTLQFTKYSTVYDQKSVLNASFTAKLDLNTSKVYYINNKMLILYLIIKKNFIYIS